MVETITIPEIEVMAELITNMKHKRVGILGGTTSRTFNYCRTSKKPIKFR